MLRSKEDPGSLRSGFGRIRNHTLFGLECDRMLDFLCLKKNQARCFHILLNTRLCCCRVKRLSEVADSCILVLGYCGT